MKKRISEEARIVAFVTELVAENPEHNEATFRGKLVEAGAGKGFTKPFSTMAPQSIEHYLYLGRMFVRLEELLNQEATGTSEWSNDDYERLLATGIVLCDKVGQINRMTDEGFLTVLKMVASMLPASKKVLNAHIQAAVDGISATELRSDSHDEHNHVRDVVATEFLREMGCQFVSTEVELEKSTDTSKGLKIDALGWKSDGTICGVEVKTRRFDDLRSKKENRFDRYIRYCNKFYVLTTDREVFQSTEEWRACKRYSEIGILLCDKETWKITEKVMPTECKKEVTSAMLLRVQTAVLNKFTKLTASVCLDKTDSNPAAVLKRTKGVLSMEFEGI